MPLPGVRPPVFPREVEKDWDHLLGFRHFLRHAYAVELDPDRLQASVLCLQRAVAATAPALEALVSTLSSGGS